MNNPMSKTKVTFKQFGKPDKKIYIKNELLVRTYQSNTQQTLVGYNIIKMLVENFSCGFKDEVEFKIESPNGKTDREYTFIQTQYFSKLKRLMETKPKYVDEGIPIFCDCCTSYTPKECKAPYHKQAYMTAKNVLSAIPPPIEDTYDDVNELRDRDEGERGEG